MKTEDILEQFQLANGLEVDVDEGYPKIISSQFGGSPGRGFQELIQNQIDSYPSHVPMEERKGEILTGDKMISITDFGTGLTLNKLKLLITLGGTDKSNDQSKIGMFGIGFFSIFNPLLHTRKVIVTTKCEGQVVELTLTVIHPEKRPMINVRLLDRKIKFSTRIEVHFDCRYSVQKCLRYAKKSLKYYPCEVTINGKAFESVWEIARQKGLTIYEDNLVSGFIDYGHCDYIEVLCKYEYIVTVPISAFPNGGHNYAQDLRDFALKEMPYISGLHAIINNNILRLTISRDSYYLDYYFELSVSLLRKMIMEKLAESLSGCFDNQLILANQYIFAHKIKKFLEDPENFSCGDKTTKSVIKSLSEAPVYRLKDKYELVSLLDIKKMRTENLPLFYSEGCKNLRWLGGEFKHDFIVIPEACTAHRGAPDFYRKIFTAIFNDVVDLNAIQGDNKKIMELVERKIVNKSALTPLCKFVGETKLEKEQVELLIEINKILTNNVVKEAISENIGIDLGNIKATFFKVKEEGAYISTGLFKHTGEPLSEDFITNFTKLKSEENDDDFRINTDILLGLRLNHPFIDYLVESKNKHKAYYTLTYIAHELALCQKLLVPYSPFYHFVKEKTATAMRKALIHQMLSENP
jgi:hypothetical protein